MRGKEHSAAHCATAVLLSEEFCCGAEASHNEPALMIDYIMSCVRGILHARKSALWLRLPSLVGFLLSSEQRRVLLAVPHPLRAGVGCISSG